MPEQEGATLQPQPVQRRVLIVAGEASGDRYGAGLIEAIVRRMPGVTFTGIGGPLMRAAGLDALVAAERIAVMGFFEVVSSLPRIREAFDLCVAELKTRREQAPDLVLLIDYPGFNLRLARQAKQAGVPVIYFISPQVWAWKPGRVRAIARNVSRMLVIFPFEEAWYRERGVEATFVGHPLVEILKRSGPRLTREEAAARFGADPARRIVGLLPGSRVKEARRNLPPILGAARLLAEKHQGLQFLMPVASTLTVGALAEMVDLPGIIFTRDDFYEAVNLCDIAIVASGTATMEVGLLEVPMVVVYRLHPLTYAIARRMTKLDTFGMINLVAGSRIVPELIQGDCTPARIAAEAERLLTDRVLHERTRRALRTVREGLMGDGAFDRAAAIIEETLR